MKKKNWINFIKVLGLFLLFFGKKMIYKEEKICYLWIKLCYCWKNVNNFKIEGEKYIVIEREKFEYVVWFLSIYFVCMDFCMLCSWEVFVW